MYFIALLMSFIRLIKITAKMSANTLKFITTFLSVGKINTINPKINPINAIAKSTVAKIVSVAILFNFLIVFKYLFAFHLFILLSFAIY